jgi:hypothetical protein
VNEDFHMSHTTDKSAQESGSRVPKITARVTWTLIVWWSVTAVAAWLVVTLTNGGWLNLHWVLLPSGVISLFVYACFCNWADTVEKQETCASLGFGLTEAEDERGILARIEEMFEALTGAKVLGTRTMFPNVQCWLAETSEVLSQDSETPKYRASTVCLFENSVDQLTDSGSFRLEPHNSVACMLWMSISSVFNTTTKSRFNLWYDQKSDERSGLSQFLTPDIRDWLGQHSRWSLMRPWTVIHNGKYTLIYRAGTALKAKDKAKYTQLISEMHVFAGLMAESRVRQNPDRVKKREKTELNQLLEQRPIRNLSRYWLTRTRVELFHLLLILGLLVLVSGDISNQLGKHVQDITGIVDDQTWLIALGAVLVGSLAVALWKNCWRDHRRNRRLLKMGEVVSGTVEHFERRHNNRKQNSNLYEIRVTYMILGETFSAKWRVYVADTRAGAFSLGAEVDQKVIVLFDPQNPKQIVLPELLASCS